MLVKKNFIKIIYSFKFKLSFKIKYFILKKIKKYSNYPIFMNFKQTIKLNF